jgi:hypothetical protein
VVYILQVEDSIRDGKMLTSKREIEALERSLRFRPSRLDRKDNGSHLSGSAVAIKSLMIWHRGLGSDKEYPVIIAGVTEHSFGARDITFLTIEEFNSHMHHHKHCYYFVGGCSLGPVI